MVRSKCGFMYVLQLSVTLSVWMEEHVLSPMFVPVPVASMALSVKLVRVWCDVIFVCYDTFYFSAV